MKAEEVIGLIPDEVLDSLSLETGVDCFVKKLSGKIVFKLFLYGILNCKIISLRILETIFNSEKFQSLFQVNIKSIKHSGLGMRLANIDYRYFEKIFQYLLDSGKVKEICFAKKKINTRKIDSTIVTLSSKLLKIGVDNNQGRKGLKYSVEINQGIPVNFVLHTEKKYMSEDIALPELIKQKIAKSGINIAIFDRGVQKRRTFEELINNKIYFISRLNSQKYIVIKSLSLTKEETPKETPTLKILSDQIIKFQNNEETIDAELRLVIGINKETKQKISFITNVNFLTATEITELYRSRWEIETFFKFIKQELNFSHLLNRSENGIRALMYLTMITAILLTIYKKTNKIVGWMVAKIKFLDELEKDLMYNWHEEITPVFHPPNNQLMAKIRSE